MSTVAAPAPVTKKWWQSKTVWFNILTMAVWVAGVITKILPTTPVALMLEAFVVPGVNLILRLFFTGMKLTP